MERVDKERKEASVEDVEKVKPSFDESDHNACASILGILPKGRETLSLLLSQERKTGPSRRRQDEAKEAATRSTSVGQQSEPRSVHQNIKGKIRLHA